MPLPPVPSSPRVGSLSLSLSLSPSPAPRSVLSKGRWGVEWVRTDARSARRGGWRRALALASAITVFAGAGTLSPAHAACMDDAQVAAMFDAHGRGVPAVNPEGLTMADAECTRAKLNRLFELQFGAPVGYKAGLTNPAVQKRFNHDAPVWGALYAPMLLTDGAVVDAAFGARPLFEADMLVRVASHAVNAARTPAEVLAAVDQVIPFVELPDLVVQTPARLDGAGVVAINVGARLGVMGRALPVPATRGERYQMLDALRDMVAVVKVDGVEIDRGKGSDVLEHPLNAVVWLVQALARDGRALKPGDLVSLGSFSKLTPPRAGQSVEVAYHGLPGAPAVKVTFR